MLHDHTPATLRVAKKVLGFAVIVATLNVAVLFATVSLGTVHEFPEMTPGRHAAAQSARAPAAAAEQPENRAPERDFDYFPDRYVNQATEPAEPIATF